MMQRSGRSHRVQSGAMASRTKVTDDEVVTLTESRELFETHANDRLPGCWSSAVERRVWVCQRQYAAECATGSQRRTVLLGG